METDRLIEEAPSSSSTSSVSSSSTSSSSSSSSRSDNNTLNFIWFGQDITKFVAAGKAGGNLERLKEWAKTNPNYTVNLWTDAGSLISLQELQAKKLLPPNVRIINFDEAQPGLRARDIPGENAHNLIKYFRNPTHGGVPNYGAASDLARALILYQHGGIYLDLDTELKYKGFGWFSKGVPLKPFDEIVREDQVLLALDTTQTLLPTCMRLANDVVASNAGSRQLADYLTKYISLMTESDLAHLVEPTRTPIQGVEPSKCPYNKARLETTTQYGPVLLRACVMVPRHPYPEYQGSMAAKRSEEVAEYWSNITMSPWELLNPPSSLHAASEAISLSSSSSSAEPSLSIAPKAKDVFRERADRLDAVAAQATFPSEYYSRGQDNAWMNPTAAKAVVAPSVKAPDAEEETTCCGCCPWH